MGMFIHNLAVRTSEKAKVIDLLKENQLTSYISEPIDKWILIFPEDMDLMFEVAPKISLELNTVVTTGFVGDSDDLIFQLYDTGKCILDFIEDKTAGDGIIFKTGKAEDLGSYISEEDALKAEQVFPAEYVFAEEKYADIITLLDIPKSLSQWTYDYIYQALNPVEEYQQEMRSAMEEDLTSVELVPF
jgi:hypothetical protein